MEEKIKPTGLGFHVKVIFLFIAFASYIALELSLNLLLIELYAQPAHNIFVENVESILRLDLFGRTLSSFGIALAIITFLPINRLIPNLNRNDIKNNTTRKIALKRKKKHLHIASYITHPLIFLLLWLMLIPSLRILVETVVHSRSNDNKLNAVRAVIYKEGYLSGVIKIQNFDQFNVLINDSDRRDLVVALIPSLAYFSTHFNRLIEQNMEKLADNFLSSHQSKRFIEKGLPKLRAFDDLYLQERQLYLQTDNRYQIAVQRLTNHQSINEEQRQIISRVNDLLHALWNNYVRQHDNARNEFRELSKNQSLRDDHHRFKKRYRAKRCDTRCKDQINIEHANYFNNLTYKNGKSLGIRVLPEHIFFGALGTEARILAMLTRGREHWLRLVYAVGEYEEYEEFVKSEEARKLLIKKFEENGLSLGSDWQINNTQAIYHVLLNKYQQQAANIWQEYQQKSQFKITEKGLDRIAFATHDIIQQQAKLALDDFYIDDFSPSMAERTIQEKWLAQQNNISFIRMLSSTAAVGAFAPGGILFDIGNNAVKLALILPISVLLSFIAIFMLFMKFAVYLWKTSLPYFVVLVIAMSLVLVVPVFQSVTQDDTYGDMMSAFAKDFNQNDVWESVKTSSFGFLLDIENGLYQNYRNIPFVKSVSEVIFKQPKTQHEPNSIDEQLFHFIGGYDDIFNSQLSWLGSALLPSFIGAQDIHQFDANITLLKRNHNIGAFMGVNLKNQNVDKITLPNFLGHTDLGLLAEQRFFYQPDLSQLASTFVSSYEDGDYLLSLANGTFLRESAIQKVERALVEVLNQQPKLLNTLNNLVSKGFKNLVLIQMNNTEKYQCYYSPTINSITLAEAINNSSFNLKTIKNCQGTF
ncbi:hypothetical protein [Paraglaciecola aestuariivivens]